MKQIEKTMRWVLIFLMTTLTFLVCIQVLFRYVFGNPLSWSEELARYLFVWLTFLGAAVGLRKKIHIGVDFLTMLLTPRVRKYLQMIVSVLLLIFLAVVIYYGFEAVEVTMNQPSPALAIPMGYVYASLPVAAIFMVIFIMANSVENWKAQK